MTPENWMTLAPTIIAGIVTIAVATVGALITGVFAFLQSRANKVAIEKNTDTTDKTHALVDGRMDALLKATKELATAVERIAGDKRTVDAVAEETRSGDARAVIVAENAKPA